MKLKALAVGVMAALSFGANASTLSTGLIAAVPTSGTTGSNLFLSVFDVTNGKTFFANLGVITGTFNYGANDSWALSGDANWASFYNAGTAADTFQFNVVGAIAQAGAAALTAGGMYVTGGPNATKTSWYNTPFATPAATTTYSGAIQNVTTQAGGLNALNGTGIGVLPAGDANAWDSVAWDTISNKPIFGNNNTATDLNTTSLFYHLGLTKPGAAVLNTATLLGSFTLSTAGGTQVLNYNTAAVSAVPVPAAVWLLGSALVGFATVARREKKAA
jgi:hypothetical protein